MALCHKYFVFVISTRQNQRVPNPYVADRRQRGGAGGEAVVPTFFIVLALKEQKVSNENCHMPKSLPQNKHVTQKRENKCGNVGSTSTDMVGEVKGEVAGMESR